MGLERDVSRAKLHSLTAAFIMQNRVRRVIVLHCSF